MDGVHTFEAGSHSVNWHIRFMRQTKRYTWGILDMQWR